MEERSSMHFHKPQGCICALGSAAAVGDGAEGEG